MRLFGLILPLLDKNSMFKKMNSFLSNHVKYLMRFRQKLSQLGFKIFLALSLQFLEIDAMIRCAFSG